MLKHTRTAILSFLAAALLLPGGTLTATADSRLPDATGAGFGDKLYRLAHRASVFRKCCRRGAGYNVTAIIGRL